MTDQESERPGSTQPGLKKSDLLTRQTGDGSFEFIVESDVSESYGYEAEPSAGLHAESHLPVGSRDNKPVVWIGAGILLLIVLIGTGVALRKGGDESAEHGAKAMDQEVAGFRPYGGGEAPAREEKPAPLERRARVLPVPEPVEEPQEQFVQEEVYEEMLPDIAPEHETEWQVGENEQIREEDEDPSALPVRSMARDRVNLKQVQLRGMDSERIRGVTGREGRRRGVTARQMERVKRSLQVDEAAQENVNERLPYEAESQEFEEEHFEEPGMEEEYYEEEEELEDEIY